MIGRVGTILGIDNGINIDELDLGTRPAGRRLADAAVDVHAGAGARSSTQLRAIDGVVDARAIELD